MSVQSALGEPLRAEIDITSMTAEEGSTLRLRVATPDAYRAAGVEYNAVLPDTQVQLMRRPGGQPYLRVSSNRAVVEPFVDVILEMNWASGRLVREYTMLFDPPVSRTAQAAPAPAAVTPAISAAPAALPPAAPAPATAAPPAPAVAAAVPRAVPAERAPVPKPTAGATVPPAKSSPAAEQPAVDQYRVRAGDTLSGIAGRTQRASVSLDQMLVALFRGNPDAFVDNNMNRLKAGAMLSVPSAEVAQQTTDADARGVIRAQSADFAAYRQQLAAGIVTARTDEPSRQAKGSVQASVQDSKQPTAAPPDKLTLSQGAVKASAPDVRLSKEAEKKDATTRMAELARNVEDLKRLQGEAAGAKPAAPTTGSPSMPAVAAAASVPGLSTSAPAVVAAAATAAPASAPAPAPAPEAAPVAAATSASASASAAAPAQAAAPASVAATAVKAAARPPAPPEPGMLESLFDNPLALPGAGVLLALLAGFGVYRLRGRMRKDGGETSFLESRLQPDSFFGASGGQRIDTRDAGGPSSTSSSMNYSLSQLDAIGDVDPVAEADVYLAYGRDLQAEEILKEAMRASPERLDIRTKLLEVYAKRRDTKGFELLAGQLFALSNGTGDAWTKAQELGRQIDPENTLYAPGGEPDLIVREGGRIVEPLDATTMPQSVMPAVPPVGLIAAAESLYPDPAPAPDLDLDLDFTVSAKAPLESPLTAAEVTRPFNTGVAMADVQAFSADSLDSSSARSTVAPNSAAGALDFDLGDLTLDGDTAPPQHAPAPSATAGVAANAAHDDFQASMPAFEISDFDQDPLSRKLELAEEFRQIGDLEGARDLLEEVLASADGTLKTKAQGMLDSLS
jgi:pilus assembly protein FimV